MPSCMYQLDGPWPIPRLDIACYQPVWLETSYWYTSIEPIARHVFTFAFTCSSLFESDMRKNLCVSMVCWLEPHYLPSFLMPFPYLNLTTRKIPFKTIMIRLLASDSWVLSSRCMGMATFFFFFTCLWWESALKACSKFIFLVKSFSVHHFEKVLEGFTHVDCL